MMQDNWSDLIKQLWWEMNPQGNYHGTPYTFNKFDDSKWLTGEGAMVHGAGHYSADIFDVADKYNIRRLNIPEGFVDRYELTNRFLDLDEDTQKFNIKNKIHQLNAFANDSYYPEQIRQSWRQKAVELNNFLDNLDYAKGNTYTVNVPNENFMLDVTKPFDKQSKYVQEKLYQIFKSNDINKNVKDLWMELDRFKPEDTRYIYDWLAEDIGSNISDELRWSDYDVQRRAGAPEASRIFDKYGIRGIRTVGKTDGPINVTFTGKDIKMANTPFQRFTNRIPTQTLGKIAEKIMSNPVVKVGGKVIEGSAVPLMVYDMLKMQGYDPRLIFGSKKEKQNALQEYRERLY